jgi:hypothetical protein
MRRERSRVNVGFNRLGIVLCAPFLLLAAVLAFLAWQNPTWRIVTDIPDGAIAWSFGDTPDEAAKQLIAKQRAKGFDLPAGYMLVGLPLETVRKDGVDWIKFRLPDGREIGIASTDSKRANETARKFLLSEQAAGRAFSDNDQLEFDGVRVAFLNFFDQDPTLEPPWLKQKPQHDWTWALVALCIGIVLYVAMRAFGWIIDGFRGSRPEA